MDFANLASSQIKELLEAQSHVWNHNYSFHNSMALRCAVQLGIPDAIQKHGQPIGLTELANALAIHPMKFPSLYRLMHFLVRSNFFFEKKLDNGEAVFDLTLNSKLLVKSHPLSLAPFVLNTMIDPSLHFSIWLRNGALSPFHIAYGKSIWEHASCSSEFNEYFNHAMASDARIVSAALVNSEEAKCIFHGIESIVDVGGGNGTMAKAIVEAFSGIKCTVLDLPHVVEGLPAGKHNIVYMGGDMFKAIPPAQVVLLKWILHDWSDEDCVKILQRCKEAIPSKEQGGKMMSLNFGGKERTEAEWKKLFLDARFNNGYKIFPILGPRSVIEIYP
uniref:Uncharacterized protein n=1 Tax=Opuntia streptacantha TaxID=393608 RepID=A0A7C8YSG1_OPUST